MCRYIACDSSALSEMVTVHLRILSNFRSSSRLRKKGKALNRSVWSLNCLGGIRHVIGQSE